MKKSKEGFHALELPMIVLATSGSDRNSSPAGSKLWYEHGSGTETSDEIIKTRRKQARHFTSEVKGAAAALSRALRPFGSLNIFRDTLS